VPTLPGGTVGTAYVTNNFTVSGGSGSYTWSIPTGGTLPPGLSLSTTTGSTTTITGTPTQGGTYTFTVQVTDSASNTATTSSLSITINSADPCASIVGGSEALLTGHYAFVLKGFDNGLGTGESTPEPALVGGVLTFNGINNNGLITAGTMDMNLNSGVQTNLTVTAGSYKVGSDHRACMALTTSAGTQHYRASLGNISGGVASTGHMIDFDTAGPFTAGTLRKQSASIPTTLSGNFAFGVSSAQNTASCQNACGGNFGAAGVFSLSSNGSFTEIVDFNNNGFADGSSTAGTGWPASPISITGGAYNIFSNGRGPLAFTPPGGSLVNVEIYVVSSSEMLTMDVDPQTSNTIFAGEALLQSGTPFSANPLSGAYIGYQSGLGSTAGDSRTTVLLINPSGTGISGTQLRNDSGTFQSKSLTGITYSVAGSGRMTVSGGGGSTGPIFYLVNANQAFILNSDNTVESGFFQSQTSISASGTYAFGTVDPQDSGVNNNSGVAGFSSPNINVTEDDNSNGSQQADQMQSFTYSTNSTGLGLIPSGCSISVTPTTCQVVFYVISPTKAVIMDTGTTGSSNPKIQVADQ
jgi:hypothetical protein